MVRGYIWVQLLGADKIRSKYEQAGIQEHTFDRKMGSYYESLVQHGTDHPNEYNGPRGYIDRDIGRTFPRHPLFASGDPASSRAIKALRRVLVAYSAHNDQIGYTQGMNYIVAMLLGFMPEEDAFWAFVSIMHKRAPPSPPAGGRKAANAKAEAAAAARCVFANADGLLTNFDAHSTPFRDSV